MKILKIETVKAFCRVGTDLEDSLLEVIANGVEAEVERFTGRLLEREEDHEQTVSGTGADSLWPLVGPVVSIDKIEDEDGDEESESSYELIGDNRIRHDSWWKKEDYTITATVGYDTVPPELVSVMYNMCAGQYKQMGQVAGELAAGAQVNFRQWINTRDFRILKDFQMGSRA